MTRDAGGFGTVLYVALHATIHRHHASGLRHHIHLVNLAMARPTLDPRVQMLAMGPLISWAKVIDAHPRYRCFRFVISREFLNSRLVFGGGGVALHARAGIWEGHQLTWVRVRVAALALQLGRQGQM